MQQDDEDDFRIEEVEGVDWQWILVVLMMLGVLLVAIRQMLPSKGADCPKGEICGD